MTADQNADHAYQEAKLIQLLIRRYNLPKNSFEIPTLTQEINEVEDVVRSYRMLKRLSA